MKRNDLERILADAAGSAGRAAPDLAVESVLARGRRRRAARRSGLGGAAVLAAAGLVLGGAQLGPLLTDTVEPAVEWPALDPDVGLGKCGSDIVGLEVTDPSHEDSPLLLSSWDLVVAEGAEPQVFTYRENLTDATLVADGPIGPFLFAARDGVVVGYSRLLDIPWPTPVELEPGTHRSYGGYGPFFVCGTGDIGPHHPEWSRHSGADYLPVGIYDLGVGERFHGDGQWVAFDSWTYNGTLTVVAEAPYADPPVSEATELPVCGESVEGFAFAEGTLERQAHIRFGERVGELLRTGSPGDTLEVRLDFANTFGMLRGFEEVSAHLVLARDGTVVAEDTWVLGDGGRFDWPPDEENYLTGDLGYWDCSTGATGFFPVGDYLLLAARTFEYDAADGTRGQFTVGYSAEFSASSSEG